MTSQIKEYVRQKLIATTFNSQLMRHFIRKPQGQQLSSMKQEKHNITTTLIIFYQLNSVAALREDAWSICSLHGASVLKYGQQIK